MFYDNQVTKLEILLCPACNLEKSRNFRKSPRYAANLRQCSNCKTQFVRFQPSDERLTEIYGPNYYQSWSTESEEMLIEIKNETYRRIIHPAKIRSNKKLLELGCAQGHGIREIRTFDCEYYGIDLNEDAIKFAKSRYPDGNFLNGVVQEGLSWNTKFDYVLMIDFIEHVRNPDQEIAIISRMLNPDGKIVLSTPRSKSLVHCLTRKYWPQYREEHLTYFSKAGMTMLFERNGFSVEVAKPTFKVMSPNYFYGQSTQFSPILVKGIAYIFKSIANVIHLRKILLPFGEMTIIASRKSNNV